jgi:CheY-like chemotaxis protein
MTAHSLEGDREKCITAGMDDYVAKPVKIEELRAVIDRRKEMKAVCHPEQFPPQELSHGEIVDLSAITALRELDTDGENAIVTQLIQVFLENTPVLIADARKAIGQGSAADVARVGHTLKGSCANFGPTDFASPAPGWSNSLAEGRSPVPVLFFLISRGSLDLCVPHSNANLPSAPHENPSR